ncbi:S41 family peptidase [Stieleria sp. TO1_6]|uniref:S41 family peptidase n=1 Tax=Stieleria tagensis TaxID=2956795 RepID=UPI00209B1038|nr:S41 family peptidase [Stieleria tagensis]MCO8123021.1 S41 family peptidase [Stieleria tagensis]
MQRSLRRSAVVLCLSAVTCSPGFNANAQQPLDVDASTAIQMQASPMALAISQGETLEENRKWSEAIRHYEKATREFPGSRQLYQRLVISRLHYDVNRRYSDKSFVASAHDLDPTQALDLYAEILSNLETHYVDSVDWSRVLLHGTAALEIALTEEKFIHDALPQTDRGRLHQFQQTIHRRIADRPAGNRFDLRGTVAFVAQVAREELGLSPTVTVLEYVSGAVSTLDPYTRLLSSDQLDDMFSNIDGNFVGLGVELETTEDALKILSVIPGGPAEEAGMKPGERIVRVEHAETHLSNPNIAADLLRGPELSMVSLTVTSPQGERRELSVQRRRVEVPCVENVHIVDPNTRIGYMRLTNFQKTTRREVEAALWELHRQGMRGVVLDVRGNPGGLLDAAVEVSDRFLSNGRILTTRGRNARENFDYVAKRASTWDVPLAVLIDKDSASASEIFAGAISDSDRGILIGQRSYGKGTVQGIFPMRSAKFGLCLTTAKFYSPNGTAISHHGVDPDFQVESPYIAARPTDDGHLITDLEDQVLQEAVTQLSAKSQLISRRP